MSDILFATFPDFPKPGISFQDISPLLAQPDRFKTCINLMEGQVAKYGIDVIAALDSRGFIFGSALAVKMNRPLIMIRKCGKLPGKTKKVSTEIEYGQVNLEIQETELLRGRSVLIVDDLLATGGTAKAAMELIESQKGVVACFLFAIDLKLTGSRNLLKDVPVEVTQPLLESSISQQQRRPSRFPRIDAKTETVILYHPSQQNMAEFLRSNYNACVALKIDWNYFKDGCPNVKFPGMDIIANCKVIFLANLYDLSEFLIQQSVLIALCRQNIESLHILWPYFTTATMERVNQEGELAVAEPMAKMMSTLPKLCKITMTIFDIHALPERFYFQDSVTLVLLNGLRQMMNEAEIRWNGKVVFVFPDDGAYKRFGNFIPSNAKVIVCTKTRNGDERKVIITGRYGFKGKDDGFESTKLEMTDALIIDDLVQSGGTLHECRITLKSAGSQRISAYCTHAVFPDASYRYFMNNQKFAGMDTFYVTDTIPQTSDVLRQVKPFRILSIYNDFAQSVGLERSNIVTPFFLGSRSGLKIKALNLALKKITWKPFIYNVNVDSGVSEQPLSSDETMSGAKQRARQALQLVGNQPTIGVGIENGIDLCTGEEVVSVCLLNREGREEVSEKRTSIPVHLIQAFTGSRVNEETFGQFLVRAGYCGKDGRADDWHLPVLGFSRIDMMIDALDIVLQRVYHTPNHKSLM